MKTEKFFSVACLKERGWTDSSIAKFLGAPDKTKDNPYYRRGAPMRMYDPERVKQAESTVEVQAFFISSQARRVVRREVTASQTEKLLQEIDTMEVRVICKERRVLLQMAIKSYNDWHRMDEYGEIASKDSPSSFLRRIEVNFVRHNLTLYDAAIDSAAGKVGVASAVHAIRKKVYDAIAAVYPHLADECAEQMRRRAERMALNKSAK